MIIINYFQSCNNFSSQWLQKSVINYRSNKNDRGIKFSSFEFDEKTMLFRGCGY